MTAATADFNTPSRNARDFELPAAATKKFFAGAIACVSATGFGTPGATATTLKAVGRVKEYVDNTSGADGAVNVKVERGCFRYNNSAAADAIALAQYGAQCYLVDDITVAKTDGSGTRSVAGIVRDVDANGVWVEF
jgi:hypothetical protein